MDVTEFDLVAPERLDEALALLRDRGAGAVAMAGGTDLMPALRQRAVTPSSVVLLSRIPDLRGIRREEDGLLIGGATTIAELTRDPRVRGHARGLVDAAEQMATVPIRNRATVAGNLATAAACGDLAPILIALGARLELRSASGARTVPLDAFFTGPRTTVLGPGELIASIHVPDAPPATGTSYVKFGYRGGSQIAVVSAAARIEQAGGRARSVRLVLGAVAPVPFAVQGASVLAGRPVEGAALDAACAAAASECRPISDIRGSESYRRAIAPVIARRALELAWKRSLDDGA